MTDHHHYGYADDHHSHDGSYAAAGHDHDDRHAERYHRHHDDESTAAGLREDLGHAEARISELEDALNAVIGRIGRLEERLNSPTVEPEAEASDTPALPGWDEMSELDKGAALLHLWKAEAEGTEYATENYPARYFDHPALTALDGESASAHAREMRAIADELPIDENERLYDAALDADLLRRQ